MTVKILNSKLNEQPNCVFSKSVELRLTSNGKDAACLLKLIFLENVQGATLERVCWYPFAQRLHFFPVTPSLHGHCPVVGLQNFPADPTT